MAMPKAFAILIHTGLGTCHYDFLLEHSQQACATTWQFADDPSMLMSPPGCGAKLKIVGRKIQDHRLMYLDYEGLVSKGRGMVRRLDGGTCEIISQAEALLVFRLAGGTMNGLFALEQTGEQWVLRVLPEQ
jgi:hypothetical protein